MGLDSDAEIDLGQVLADPQLNGTHTAPPSAPPPVALAARRADIDIKQAQVAWLLESMQCEAALLLAPAHVCWVTSGMNVRGLIRSEEHTSELQSHSDVVCRLLLEKKKRESLCLIEVR